MSEQIGVTRKNFLKKAGLLTVGAIAGSEALSLAKPKKAAAYTAMPWPYATLDLNLVRKRAYENYYIAGCMYATASSLITTLQETVGTPWDTLPLDMFKYGSGGAYSWGTVCGALNGVSYVIQLCAGTSVDAIINDIFGWYTTYPFPSNLMDAYAKYTRQRQTVSDSPLCHQSSSIWAYTTKNKINSNERKDRCAKVAGDTAAKAAELLNAWKAAGSYTSTFAASSEYQRCMECHVGATSTYDNAQGKANCTGCHDDKVTGHY